ncbi:hypothetical protein QCA50_007347 [Cerrena zonata]|uniref:Uncharacterized protein n=1 Tax=Cerrena zonata TaxID=2478898 RepID=A0AAW0GEJ2_9APHY
MALYFTSATRHSLHVPSPSLLHPDYQWEEPGMKGYAPLQDSGLVEFDVGRMKWWLEEGLALQLEEEEWAREEEEMFGGSSSSDEEMKGGKRTKGGRWRQGQRRAKRERREKRACARAIKAIREGTVVGKSGVCIVISEAD